jgi:hypothetical protein
MSDSRLGCLTLLLQESTPGDSPEFEAESLKRSYLFHTRFNGVKYERAFEEPDFAVGLASLLQEWLLVRLIRKAQFADKKPPLHEAT